MARLIVGVSFVLVGFACAMPARADLIADFFHSIPRDIKRRNCWPKPFVSADRAAVRAPLATMVNNGWRYQNMLGEPYFSEESGALTEAGRIKVHWIMTQAPRHRRTIYVCQAETPEKTSARLESVRQLASQLLPEGQTPSVFQSNVPALGWPAKQASVVGRSWDASMPKPRLNVRAN